MLANRHNSNDEERDIAVGPEPLLPEHEFQM
jgi:hypothetical protein